MWLEKLVIGLLIRWHLKLLTIQCFLQSLILFHTLSLLKPLHSQLMTLLIIKKLETRQEKIFTNPCDFHLYMYSHFLTALSLDELC